MTLKMRIGIIFLVIAFCTLTSVVFAAPADESDTDSSDLEALAADFEAEIEGIVEEGKELEAALSDFLEVDDFDVLAEGELALAAKKLSTELSDSEIKEVLEGVYDGMDDVAFVYVVTPRGVISSIYPDEYSEAIGDFVGRSPVGGTIIKAREYIQTDEYTSAREKITGYDAVQPIFSDEDKYLGAVIAKIIA